jgi:hypothetical protein
LPRPGMDVGTAVGEKGRGTPLNVPRKPHMSGALLFPCVTVGDVLHQMHCARRCGGRPLAAWLVTGPTLNERVRPRKWGY